jgi:hypothetical protein
MSIEMTTKTMIRAELYKDEIHLYAYPPALGDEDRVLLGWLDKDGTIHRTSIPKSRRPVGVQFDEKGRIVVRD